MQCRGAIAAALAEIPHNLCNYAVSPLTKGWNRGLFLFVRVRLQECVEVTHRQIVTPNNTHVRDVLTILVQSLNSCDYIVQMLLGQTAAVDCEANYVSILQPAAPGSSGHTPWSSRPARIHGCRSGGSAQALKPSPAKVSWPRLPSKNSSMLMYTAWPPAGSTTPLTPAS